MILVRNKVAQKLFKFVVKPRQPSESIDKKAVGELSKSSHFTYFIKEHGKSLEILIFDSVASGGLLGTSIYNYPSCNFLEDKAGTILEKFAYLSQ